MADLMCVSLLWLFSLGVCLMFIYSSDKSFLSAC